MQKFWTNSLFPETFRTKLVDSACLKVWQFAEYVDDVKDWTGILSSLEPPIVDRMHIASVRRAYKAACARDAELLSRGRDYPGVDMDAPIESNRRRTFIEEHARHYRFQLQLSRQPSDTLLDRLDREKDRGIFTVINLAKVASVAAQSAHTKHIEVAPGISFNLGTHEPPEQGDSKAMGLHSGFLTFAFFIIATQSSVSGKSPLQQIANRCGARGKLSHTLSTLSQTWRQQTSLVPKCGLPMECCDWQSSICVPA